MKGVIPFVKYRFICFGLSIALAVIFALGTAARGGFNFGIDFIGGIKLIAKFEKGVDEGRIRNALSSLDPMVQKIGQEDRNEYIISTKLLAAGDEGNTGESLMARSQKRLERALTDSFPQAEVLSVEGVGPAIGAYLRSSALNLILISIVLMTVYLTFRFEFKYSVGVMVAVVHDVILATLFCGMAGVEFNIPIIAAILTIFGYSVNDTIVIFDRIRENLQSKTKQPLREIIDISVTQTLSRTLLTNMLTLFSVLSIYIIGSQALNDFALVLFFGMIIGTYSTIYIASPVVMYWEKYFAK